MMVNFVRISLEFLQEYLPGENAPEICVYLKVFLPFIVFALYFATNFMFGFRVYLFERALLMTGFFFAAFFIEQRAFYDMTTCKCCENSSFLM